jgi:hypothetical protein
VERCRSVSEVPCLGVMVNGDFLEGAFIEWAKGAKVRDIRKLKAGFLGMP